MSMYPPRRVLLVTTLLLPFAFCPQAFAQAWVPPKGQGDLTLIYQNFYTKDHTDGDGQKFNAGQVRLFGITHIVDYGLTDKLAASLSVPYAWGKYSGNYPHQLPIDAGQYNASFQDLGVGVRYNVRTHPLMLTPFMRVSFPMEKYEYFAHSAIGLRLWEVSLGINFGRRIDRILPNSFFQGRYSFGLSQRVVGRRPNHSHIDVELGHFLTRRLSVRALAYSMFTHGGINDNQLPATEDLTNAYWTHHDQILNTHLLNLGGGFSYSLNRSLDIFASMMKTVWSHDHHPAQPGIVIGVNWSFRTRRAVPSLALQEDAADNSRVAVAGRTVRCTCK